MAEFPPNLITYITNGFNVKTGDFVSAPIFQVPADSGQAVTFGLAQKTYAVPEGFMVDGVASFKTVSKNTLLHTDMDFKAAISLGLSMRGEGKIRKIDLYGGSSWNMALSGHLFHSLDEEHFLSYAVQTICQVERLSKSPTGNPPFDIDGLTPNFQTAVSKLSATAPPSQWTAFFEIYGTHILLRGSLGGYFLAQISTRKLQVESDFAAELSASMETGFNARVASGSLNLEGAIKGSAYLNDVMVKSTTRYSCRGGMFSTELHFWVLSCFRNPVLVPGIHGLPAPVMASIADLFPADIQPAADAALRQYLLDGHILDEPTAASFDQAYVSEAATLVSANLTPGSNVAGWVNLKINSTISGQAWANNTPGLNPPVNLPYGSLLSPVPADVPYGTGLSTPSLTGSVHAYPMLNPTAPGSAIGAGKSLSAIQVPSSGWTDPGLVPKGNGILVVLANVGYTRNSGVVALLEKGGLYYAVTSCGGNALYNSFAAPIIAGKSYLLAAQAQNNANEIPVTFYPIFYPLVGVAFGTPSTITPRIVYPATTDGLLIGFVNYADTGTGQPHATLCLYSGPVAEKLDKSPLMASTSADAATTVLAGTAMKPVRRGEYFTAVLYQSTVNTTNPLSSQIWWFPLVPASN